MLQVVGRGEVSYHPAIPPPSRLAWISRLLSQFTRRKLRRHTHGHHMLDISPPLPSHTFTVWVYLRSAILIQDLIHHPQTRSPFKYFFKLKIFLVDTLSECYLNRVLNFQIKNLQSNFSHLYTLKTKWKINTSRF